VIYKSLQIILFFSSLTAVGTEFTVSGVVILVTMTCNSIHTGTGVNSRFGLRFLRSQNNTVLPPERNLYPTTFVTDEGRHVASFPHDIGVNYTNDANHLMLISRPSGRTFNLARTFLDAETTHDYNSIFGIEDEAEKTRFSLKGM